MHSFEIDAAKAQMRYLEFQGAGPALIMLHGLGCASSFEFPHVALAPPLRGRHTILIDLPGFGFSGRPDAFGYRVNDHAGLIARFVQERALGPVDLFGHSMGGSVAIEVAALLDECVVNLVVAEANLDAGGGTFSRAIEAYGEAGYLDHGHTATIDRASGDGFLAWAATMRQASARAVYLGAKSLVDGAQPNWRTQFLRHPARKAFIFGQRSLPDADYDALSSHGVHVLTVPNAGHSMGLDNPAGLAEAIAAATAGIGP